VRPIELNALFTPLEHLQGIGPKTLKHYQRLLGLEIPRLVHLLFHLPFRVVDRRLRRLSDQLQETETLTVSVQVGCHYPPPARSRAPYKVVCEADGQTLTLIFFKARAEYINDLLPEGEVRVVSGRLQQFDGHWQMAHPDFVLSSAEYAKQPAFEPVYPLTAGLTNKGLQRFIASHLADLPQLLEWQDAAWLNKQAWQSFTKALHALHNPQGSQDLSPHSPNRQRLAYDELLANQLALAIIRNQQRKGRGRKLRAVEGGKVEALRAALPYDLTKAQEDALKDIDADLASEKRMLRLVQGDVGSGKTAVALLAMGRAVENGLQAAIMAPTEILARQHFETMQPLCEAANIRLGLLIGKDNAIVKRANLKAIENGEVEIVIGTHALFQKGVEFKQLGLVVIDEQHRFGVHQRLALSNKANMGAELLVMTATPIPRTLVLSYFGDMDVSRIMEKPKGRQPIDTRVISQEKLGDIVAGLKRHLEHGAQVYWVCPLVEDSEVMPITSAEERFASLQQHFGDKVGIVHGRMTSAEKQAAMARFEAGETRILVATTVIEVGVNVPNATVMVIEHAERFGLSQLHQLRGRVGRGEKASMCLLVYGQPLTKTGKARLEVMRSTEDGFKIAEEDLKLRGEGEVLGTRQSGEAGFKVADLAHHGALLEAARDDVRLILTTDPKLINERGTALRQLLYLFERDLAVQLLSAG